MKKVIAFILVMMMCMSLCLNVAAEGAFAPSVTYKPAPEIVGTTGDDGKQTIGAVKNEIGEVVTDVAAESLVVTPVSKADENEKISAEAAQTLKACYEQLNVADLNVGDVCTDLEKVVANFLAIVSGAEKLAHEDIAQAGGLSIDTFEATDKNYDHVALENLVVKDLFDVSILDVDLESYLSDDSNTIDLTFDVAVGADDFVAVMVYKNAAWSMIDNVINNGDGTITCTFSHFCPVAVLTIPAPQEEAPVETEPVETEPVETEPVASEPAESQPTETEPVTPETPADNTLWYIIIGAAVVAVVVVIVVASKKNKKGEEVKTN